MQRQYKQPEPIKPRGNLEEAAASYLAHVVNGESIRSIAQDKNVHPSTIMRRIRKIESLRDDPVLDQYLNSAVVRGEKSVAPLRPALAGTGPETMSAGEKTLLKRLGETGSQLVVSKGLKKAMVVRTNPDQTQSRTAVVNAHLAGSSVIKDWLRCVKTGRVSLYEITEAGRAALKRAIAQDTVKGKSPQETGPSPDVFSEQHKE